MGQVNAYFQLDIRNDGTFVKIFPPKENGNLITINEITSYLNDFNCNAYDLKELNRAINLNSESEVKVSDNVDIVVNETMNMKVSLDKMVVTCRFYPASATGKKLDVQEMLSDLKCAGIVVGIKQEEILSYLKERLYCTNYIIAAGIMPIHGKDAKIEYFFHTNVELKPKKNEDGTVDYHELGTISHINAGECLARLTPEDYGKAGQDVYGQEIKPRTVRSQKLEFANNITLSDDKNEIYSNVTGHASLINGKVFVSDVYEVAADVDNSVGNIDYPGSVLVKGNVKGGFSIYAKGDIIVEGIVEDAFLQAEGQIVVKRGIHGMTKGLLKAKGNILCKFIENAIVVSGGYIETESILHSNVSAMSEIHVNGKRGFITGGLIRAGNLIEAQTIGSELGATTKIEVGIEPEKKERYSQLQKIIQLATKDINQIRPILVTYSEKIANGEQFTKEKVHYVQQLAQALQSKQKEITEVNEEYNQLHMTIRKGNNARIKVSKSIYPGVIVSISDISLTLKEEHSFSQIVCEQCEIKVIPL